MFTYSQYLDFIAHLSVLMYVDYLELSLLSFFFFTLWFTITTQSFRYKFIYFLLFLGTVAAWGFWYSYDGVIFIMLLTEFLIVLLFLLVFLSFKFQTKNTIKNSKLFFFFYTVLLCIYILSLPFSTSKQFSTFNFLYAYTLDIVSGDLFLFFHFFFVEAPVVVVFVALTLGLISIFFVASYYCFRFLQQRRDKNINSVFILRKQLQAKQAYFRPHIRIFQK